MNYLDFASKISFYEFLQEEFYNPHFNVNNYNDEIKVLKDKLTIDKLTKLLESHPRIIDIFEEVFQLRRFTNSQYIHFCFDVNTLNNFGDERILEHIDNSILKFENGSINNDFIKLFEKYFSFNNNKQEKIFAVKRAITEYIKKFSEMGIKLRIVEEFTSTEKFFGVQRYVKQDFLFFFEIDETRQ